MRKLLTHIKDRRTAWFILTVPARIPAAARMIMHANAFRFLTGLLGSVMRAIALAQQPPSAAGAVPPARAGRVNDPLRNENSAFTKWGFGGSVRARFFLSDYILQSLSTPAFGSQDANFLYAHVNLNS